MATNRQHATSYRSPLVQQGGVVATSIPVNIQLPRMVTSHPLIQQRGMGCPTGLQPIVPAPRMANRNNQNLYFGKPSSIDQNQIIVTLLKLCNKQVAVCRGCKTKFSFHDIHPEPPFDLVAVTKTSVTLYRNGGPEELPPSNGYFHVILDNPVLQPLHCLYRGKPNLNRNFMELHFEALQMLEQCHRDALRSMNLFCGLT